MAQNVLQQLVQTNMLLGDLSQAMAVSKWKLFLKMIMSKMQLVVSSVENYKDLELLNQGDVPFQEPFQEFNPLSVIKSAIDLTQRSEVSLRHGTQILLLDSITESTRSEIERQDRVNSPIGSG